MGVSEGFDSPHQCSRRDSRSMAIFCCPFLPRQQRGTSYCFEELGLAAPAAGKDVERQRFRASQEERSGLVGQNVERRSSHGSCLEVASQSVLRSSARHTDDVGHEDSSSHPCQVRLGPSPDPQSLFPSWDGACRNKGARHHECNIAYGSRHAIHFLGAVFLGVLPRSSVLLREVVWW
ncbi:hypothetical protein VTI74DRAFT_8376 [Chaetomium olivicolor]